MDGDESQSVIPTLIQEDPLSVGGSPAAPFEWSPAPWGPPAAAGAAAEPEGWSGERDGGFPGNAVLVGEWQVPCEPSLGGQRVLSAFPATTAVCEGEDACREGEVCVKPGLCRCKPGFFGADCSSRECLPRSQPLPSPFKAIWMLGGLPAFSPSCLCPLPSQAAPSSTGATTASGAARATPTGAATPRAATAPATPTTGEGCASSPASAAPTAAVTP